MQPFHIYAYVSAHSAISTYIASLILVLTLTSGPPYSLLWTEHSDHQRESLLGGPRRRDVSSDGVSPSPRGPPSGAGGTTSFKVSLANGSVILSSLLLSDSGSIHTHFIQIFLGCATSRYIIRQLQPNHMFPPGERRPLLCFLMKWFCK